MSFDWWNPLTWSQALGAPSQNWTPAPTPTQVPAPAPVQTNPVAAQPTPTPTRTTPAQTPTVPQSVTSPHLAATEAFPTSIPTTRPTQETSFSPELIARMRTPQPGSIAEQTQIQRSRSVIQSTNFELNIGSVHADIPSYLSEPVRFARTMGAVLSSTDIFAKAASTEARGVGSVLGYDTGYQQSVNELSIMTANRLQNKPGAVQLFEESPISAGLLIGAEFKAGTFIAREALIGVGSRVATVAPRLGFAIGSAQALIEPAVTLGGLGYVGYDISKSKDIYEGIGKVATYAAMTPGASLGYELTGIGISKLQTITLTRAEAPNQILNPRVEAGLETFPTTHAGSFKEFKTEFLTPEGGLAGFHATSSGYGKKGFTIKGLPESELRNLDVPGMYISPVKQGASTAFLRLPTKGMETPTSFESFLSSSPMKPEIYKISGIEDIQRIKGGLNVKTSREFLYGTEPNIGSAYIEPKMELGRFKGEAQAVLPKGTIISSPERYQKISVKGYDIPYSERIIENVNKISKETPKIEESVTKETEKIFSERRVGSSTPFSRPLSSLGMLSKMSFEPSDLRISKISKNIKSSAYVSDLESITSISKEQSSIIKSSSKITSKSIASSIADVSSSFIEPDSRIFMSSKVVPSSFITPSSRTTPTPSSIIEPTSRIVPSYNPPEYPTYTPESSRIITPSYPKLSFPDFVGIGKKKKKVRRKISEYAIENYFPDLEEVLGSFGSTRKSKKTKTTKRRR